MPAETMKVAVLAGGGALVTALITHLRQAQTPFHVVAFTGFTPPDVPVNSPHTWLRLGRVGALLRLLNQQGVTHVCLAGGIRRPDLRSLRLDWTGARLVRSLLKQKALGDDRLLRGLLTFLENHGFTAIGAHSLLPDLLCPQGVIGQHQPTTAHHNDIALAFRAAKTLGSLDIGQAVIVKNGRVLGVEGVEGTDGLISRLAPWSRGAILLKSAKPDQDTRVDLPTLGPQTVASASAAGLAGIVGEAGRCLLLDPEKAASAADQGGLFLYGYQP